MKFRNPDHATRAIIEAAKTKLKHAANVARGKSAFWYLMGGGVGGGALLAGAGILCGGYSYIVGNKVIAQQVTEGVKAVLAHTTIKTDGTVTLAGDREVTLKTPAVVSLDPNTALLRVVAPADMPRPSPEQVRQDDRPAAQAAATTFFVFHDVEVGADKVQTGWVYESSDQQQPSRQFCQYVRPTHAATRAFITIGNEGRMELPETAPPNVDLGTLRAAFAKCVWTGSTQPAPVAPVAPVQTIQIHAAKR
jgi:hypothetical protein